MYEAMTGIPSICIAAPVTLQEIFVAKVGIFNGYSSIKDGIILPLSNARIFLWLFLEKLVGWGKVKGGIVELFWIYYHTSYIYMFGIYHFIENKVSCTQKTRCLGER